MNKKTTTERKTKSSSKPRSVSKNKKKMKRMVVDTYFAFAIVSLLAGGLTMYTWIGFDGVETDSAIAANLFGGKISKQEIGKADSKDNCVPHYYDGEAKVHGWKADKQIGDGIIVQIDPKDVSELPTVGQNSNQSIMNLVGASQSVQSDINAANEANPAMITIKGYAITCDSSIPMASIEPATNVFKKS